jgi:hypothetical protein
MCNKTVLQGGRRSVRVEAYEEDVGSRDSVYEYRLAICNSAVLQRVRKLVGGAYEQ